jgi:hypothetical protein
MARAEGLRLRRVFAVLTDLFADFPVVLCAEVDFLGAVAVLVFFVLVFWVVEVAGFPWVAMGSDDWAATGVTSSNTASAPAKRQVQMDAEIEDKWDFIDSL